MANQLWPSLYTGDGTQIRKWLYGSVLMRDWYPAGSAVNTSLANFNPFDPVTQNLIANLTTPIAQGGYGFYEIGAIEESGVSFNPKFSTDQTKIWQSRRTQRTDITEDDEEIMFTAAQSNPLIDALYNNLPIGTNGASPQLVSSLGSLNYAADQELYSDIVYRQMIIIGVDGSINANGQAQYIVEVRPRVSLSKKGKRDFQAKKLDGTELTWFVYPDPASGFVARRFRGGPAWVTAGGPVLFANPNAVTAVATTTPAHSAQVVFNAPVSNNGPFTYSIQQVTGGNPSTAAATFVLGTAPVTPPTANNADIVPSTLSATPSGTGGTFAAGTYYWVITATTVNGESTRSNEVNATLSGSTSSVALNWTQVAGANGYKVYRGTTTGGEATLVTTIGSGSTVTYTDTGTAGSAGTVPSVNTAAINPPSAVSATGVGTGGQFPAGTYYYVFTNMTAQGESSKSTEVSATLSGSTSSVNLAFTPGAGSTNVKVYRGTVAGGENALVATLSPSVSTWTDTGAYNTVTATVTGLTASSSYTFTPNVTAADGATALYPVSNTITAS